jgi:hypothetical protein
MHLRGPLNADRDPARMPQWSLGGPKVAPLDSDRPKPLHTSRDFTPFPASPSPTPNV